MYLDNAIENKDYTGKIKELKENYSPKNKTFAAIFFSGDVMDGDFKRECIMQKDKTLGEHFYNFITGCNKISKGKKITIRRTGCLYRFSNSSKSLIGLISSEKEWSNDEDRWWYNNNKKGFSREQQAAFLGRSIEEIKQRENDVFNFVLTKERLAKLSNNEIRPLKISDNLLEYGVAFDTGGQDTPCIIGKKRIQPFTIINRKDTLFASKYDAIQNLFEYSEPQFLDYIYDIYDPKINNIPFFTYIKKKYKRKDISIWIKLGDIHNKELYSYSYAVFINRNNEINLDLFRSNVEYFTRLHMRLQSELYEEAFENTKKMAIKTARAAIMSRNMSHNLGSHVMAYLKQKLSSDWNNDPYISGVSRFLGYLQERQDYIAIISTDHIPYCAPVNLIDAIYDELNPDLRSLRNGDINIPSNILLNYIAKSESLSRENRDYKNPSVKANDIQFKFKDQPNNEEIPPKMNNINLFLPGGLVGRQAIFSILENIIRNAAKHNATNNTENLEFTLDIIDGFKLKNGKIDDLNDHICDANLIELYKSSTDIGNLYLLTITDNKFAADDIIEQIKKGLYEPFIDEAGRMTTASKGLKEIRISATWLRGDNEEEHYLTYGDKKKNKKAPIVAIERDKKGHLRYIICIKKKPSVAIIEEGLTPEDINFFKTIVGSSNNEWVIYAKADQYLCDSDKDFSYTVVANNKIFEKIRPKSSNRICIWSISDNERKIIGNSMDKTLYKICQIYSGLTDNEPPIYIWDDKATEHNQQPYKKIHVSSLENECDTAQFVYRKHHASNFMCYWKNKRSTYTNVSFIEGITGDNSSDRLIRREPLNEYWYYSHLYAMKKRVAILDERIFRIIHNIDEKEFIDGRKEIPNLMKKVNDYEDINTIKKQIYDSEVFSHEEKKHISSLATKHEILNYLSKFRPSFKDIITDTYLSPLYSEKGIHAYSIIPDEDDNLALIGCFSNDFGEKNTIRNTFKKFAVFTKNSERAITLTPLIENIRKYDYISFHQGILDKIYEFYGIRAHSDANDKLKCDVTTVLNNYLSSNQPIGANFIPRCFIHSGRAKPTIQDMPQKFPFIQYSAIENAVTDCKVSLIELLDFARYE